MNEITREGALCPMSPEREAFARLRLERLQEKLDNIERARASADRRDILVNQYRSTTQAIRRWKKELSDAGLVS